ncbi:MAG: hypothetical protein ACW98Y_21700, partial [Candidatus Thorarchaeota archaeon]
MDRTRVTLFSMIFTILIFPGVVLGMAIAGPLTPAQAPTDVSISIVGSENAPAVVTSLELDESISIDKADTITQALLSSPDAIFLLDIPLGTTDIAMLTAFITGGGGLFISSGPTITKNATGFQDLGITTSENLIQSTDNSQIVTRMMDQSHPIMTIDWSSAPPTETMSILPALGASSTTLLANDTGFGTGGAPILVHTTLGSGNILLYTPWLNLNATAEASQVNYELVLWPYFNYFLYSSSVYLSSQSPLTYAEWDYSPVPHIEQQIVIGLLVFVIGIVTYSSYRGMKKKSKEKKEILSEIERAELLADTGDEVDEWEEIGMHRQLGGFLIQLFITLILVIPRVVLSIMIYPRFIMPFPQAAGWFSFSVNLFLGVWTLFDLGTSVALAKYFAEFRISQPEEAIKY